VATRPGTPINGRRALDVTNKAGKILRSILQGKLQHNLNALNLSARLRSLGLSRGFVAWFGKRWEKAVHPLIYKQEKAK